MPAEMELVRLERHEPLAQEREELRRSRRSISSKSETSSNSVRKAM